MVITYISIMLTMMLAMTLVGRSLAQLLPYRLRPIGKLYFSPLFGLAIFIFLVSINGWLLPFKQWLSLLELGIILALSLYFARKNDQWSTLLRYCLFIILFSLFSTIITSSQLFRFDGYNTFDDTFTYLVQGQWLQTNSFSTKVVYSGYYPATSQILAYQVNGSRMGGTFFLGWLQSLYGIKWSYFVYPAAIALPFTAGSLAIAGAVNLIVRRSRKIAVLTAIAATSMFSGITFGLAHGFFPQAFGLAFVVGSLSLFSTTIHQASRITSLKERFFGLVPVSVLFAALVFCYNDMLPFVSAGLLGYLIFAIVLDLKNAKYILLTATLTAAQILILINIEFIRVIQNVIKILFNVGSGSMVIGYPVPFRPYDFLAFSYGFRSFDNWILKDWIFGVYTPYIFFIFFAFILISIIILLRKKLVSPLLMILSILFIYFFFIIYFRYFTKAIHPNEVGNSFLQFKMAKWASPFSYILMGTAFAYFYNRFRYKVVVGVLTFIVLYSAVVQIRIEPNITKGFIDEVGYKRSPFKAFLSLRKKVVSLKTDNPIYLNLGADHSKLRQMIIYVLQDKRLASDYTDDGYIGSPKMPIGIADWVIEYANQDKKNEKYKIGNMVLKKVTDVLPFSQSVTQAGYGRESNGVDFWYWTAKQLSFRYNVLTDEEAKKRFKLKFIYQSPIASQQLKVRVANKEVINLKMDVKSHEYFSRPFKVNNDKFDVEFESEGLTVQASPNDPRKVSFLIQNYELVPVK